MAARDPGRTPARRHRARAADRTPRTRDRLPRRFRRGGGTTGRGGGRADAGRAAGYPGRAAGGGGRPVRQPAGAARPVQGHLHHRRRRPRDGSRVARALRSGRYRALAGDVVEMVHRIVDEVAGEGLHGEAGSVAAAAGALPLGAGHALEPGGDGGRRLVQRRGDLGGVLLGVAVGDGGLVLVPVREQRVVLAEHQLEPLVVQPEHVADVAGVLQRGPLIRLRPGPGVALQRGLPGGGVRHDHAGDGLDGKASGVEAALGAGALQHPGPVLGVRDDRHARMLPTHRVRTLGQEILPFLLDVPEPQLAALRRRLRATRWPEPEPVPDWSQGVPLAYLRDLCDYWADGYDWRRAEARLNALPLFRTEIDGLSIVFAHVRSPRPDALPLILTHGWPGSVVEFLKVIGPLSEPGDGGDAFHVVCPSLPGYGFSGKPGQAGWGVERIARAWAELMARLGYSRYGAAGSDWGTSVSVSGGQQDRAHVAGIHLVPPLAGPD